LFRYFGGKAKQAKWIDPFIPYDIKTYVEPFGGAFWVYLKGGFESQLVFHSLQKIVYNDFNRNNVNLFRCMRFKEFREMVENTQADDESLFLKFRDSFFASGPNTDLNDFELTDKPDFERGLKYAYLICHTFSGFAPTAGRNISRGRRSDRYISFQNNLKHQPYLEKLKAITDIENLDYRDVIQKYDNEWTFYYLDPPYFRVGNYTIDTFDNIEKHLELALLLKNIRGRFLLSYYRFDELEEWFPKNQFHWEVNEYDRSSIKKEKNPIRTLGMWLLGNQFRWTGEESKQSKGEEIIIMNY
jgi:DNA adenine methylase